MLLFKEEHVPPILSGQKTETRRLGKKRWNVGATHLAKTKMLSKEYFARLKILYVFQQRLGDISDEEVKREGYSSVLDYFVKFAEINKIQLAELNYNMMIWAVGFEVV